MVKVDNLVYYYNRKDKKAVDGLSFTLMPGEALVLAGPNGSGKSTAILMLAEVLKPKSGTVKKPECFGYVPQGVGLFEDMKVADNIAFFYKLSKARMPSELPLGLEEYRNKKVSQLSGGIAKKVSIACALAGNPELMILDEPCAGLDILSRISMQKLVMQLKRQGISVIYACHDSSEFEPFYDSLIYMGKRPYRRYERAEMGVLEKTYSELFQDDE